MRGLAWSVGVLLCWAAIAAAEPITLAWSANTEPDIASYKVYWGTSPGVYPNSLNVGNVTQVTIGGLNPALNYYFVITAIDTSNNESAFSVERSGRPRKVISW